VSLFSTVRQLKGNPRACVYTEPLWGLSMNLCMPYLSIYMLSLGLSDTRIGFIVTINLLSQMVFSIFSGPVIDKMGRRKSTAIFDVLAWCIPALIWWRAEGFWFFLAAAVLNGATGLVHSSWTCLLIEDAEKKQVTRIFSIVIAFGQFSAFFAPISAILISRLTLIPAIRILFLNGFILMAIKVSILYLVSTETAIGRIRMQETKNKSVFELLSGYGDVMKLIFRSKGIVFSIIIAALMGTVGMLNNTFWPIIVNRKLYIPESVLPYFMVFRSVLAIVFLFFVIPRLFKKHLKLPLVLAFLSYFAGQALLVLVPAYSIWKYPLLCTSLVFDGFGLAMFGMLTESLIALYVDKTERARIMAVRFVVIMLATAPFGWIGGFLSDISRNLPFVLNLVLLAAGIVLTIIYYKNADYSQETEN